MAFDSGQNPSLVVWLLLIAVWTYPVWPIVLSVAAWRAYARKKDKLAVVLTTLTFLPALVLVLSIVLPAIFSRPAPL